MQATVGIMCHSRNSPLVEVVRAGTEQEPLLWPLSVTTPETLGIGALWARWTPLVPTPHRQSIPRLTSLATPVASARAGRARTVASDHCELRW